MPFVPPHQFRESAWVCFLPYARTTAGGVERGNLSPVFRVPLPVFLFDGGASMARPLYETRQDLENELGVMNTVAAIAKMTFRKMTIRYSVDYALMKGDAVHAWVEVKCRKNEMKKYPTLMISAGKLMEGVNLSYHTGKPFYLVVKWQDGIGRVKLDSLLKYKLTFGGRFDRNDAQDVEPVYEIPTSDFLLVNKGESA